MTRKASGSSRNVTLRIPSPHNLTSSVAVAPVDSDDGGASTADAARPADLMMIFSSRIFRHLVKTWYADGDLSSAP